MTGTDTTTQNNESRGGHGCSSAVPEPTREELLAVYQAARGLCGGYDWNLGAHAKTHGYRAKLLRAVHAIEPVMDLDSKIWNATRNP